ncbi:MAG: antitoxin [Desulfovibrionales bacterium]|nr:antitoxin [Desulfovibrionales bacterium]
MTTMTLRGIDEDLAKTLKEMSQQQGVSLNALAIRLIREATGLDKKKRTATYHDLDELAGTWSEADELNFRQATVSLEAIDTDLWK